jgi:hypothetical protein
MKEINNKANFNSSLVGRLGGAEYINLYKQYHETIKTFVGSDEMRVVMRPLSFSSSWDFPQRNSKSTNIPTSDALRTIMV